MVQIGSNVTKTINNVFLGLRSLNFTFYFLAQNFKNAIFWPLDNLKQTSKQKNGRLLSWNLSKVSINLKQSKLT
jgi:hypothetical protein